MQVLVYGATGAQGSAVARQLIARGHRIRAVLRAPDRPERQSALETAGLAAAAVEIVAGDLSDAASLRAASVGVDAIFVQVPVAAPPDVIVLHLRHALSAARHAAEQANGGRRPHVVLTTSSVVPTSPTGYSAPDARIAMLTLVRELTPHAVVLSPTLYLDNFSGPLRAAIEYGGVLPQGVPEDVPVAYLSLDDHAAFAVAALERPQLAGQIFPVAGLEALTGPALAATVSHALRRPVRYQPTTFAETVGTLAPHIGNDAATAVAEMYAWEGGPGRALLAPDLTRTLEALPVALTPVATWAARAFG